LGADGTRVKKPEVVRVIARLNVGGPALHVMNLSGGLKERYPTLLVAGQVDTGEADLSVQAESRGVDLHTLPELGRRIHPWQDVVALAKLVRLFRRVRPQIVHTHTAKAGTLGRIAALLAGVPVRVHTFHGHVFRGYFGPAATRLVLAVERLLARTSTRIVTISESQASELVGEFRLCSPDRVEIVPLGLDLSPLREERISALRGELRRELGAGDRPIVTIVGRLVPIKNHDLFLEMAAILRDQGRSCLFLIVGGGTETERLQAKTRGLDLADDVRFLGWRGDLDRIYADTDVVVLSSNNEGTPVCLIEALASGCAVASTDVGGVADVLEHGRLGVLTPPGDAAALVRAVGDLLDRPELREELGRRGARAVPERFGVKRLLRDIEALYDRLLARESAAS
jgi:glycosyltransferase involved in cell wall biosynthesis